MLRPMEIPVDVSRIDAAQRSMQELARATRDVGAQARAIRLPAGSGAIGGGSATAIRRAASVQAAHTVGQAMQVRAQAQLATAQVRADTQAARAQAAQIRADQQLARAQAGPVGRATPQQKLMQAVLSSRFSAQGIQPLVGRTLAAAGIEGAAATPVLGAIAGFTAAALAAKKFAEFVLEAAGRAHDFGIAVAVSGGTGREVAGLRGMGVGVGEIGAASSGLRGLLASSPLAQATAGQLGIGPVLPQSVGSQDNAAIMQAALEGLRKVTNAENQLRMARILGLESYIDQIRVSDEVWERGKRLADLSARIYSPQAVQAARDLAGEARNLALGNEAIQAGLAKPFLNPALNLTAGAAEISRRTGGAIGSDQGQKAITGVISEFLEGISPALAATFRGLQGGPGANEPVKTSQDRNTDALDRLAGQLQALNQNIGGGPRTASAFPIGYFAAAGAFQGGDAGFKRYAEEERRALEEHARRLGPGAG